jgi:hypothetical protein
MNGDFCDREPGSLLGQEHGDATKLPVGTRFADVGPLADAGVRNGWRHPPVHAVARGEGAEKERGACDVGRELDGSEDAARVRLDTQDDRSSKCVIVDRLGLCFLDSFGDRQSTVHKHLVHCAECDGHGFEIMTERIVRERASSRALSHREPERR